MIIDKEFRPTPSNFADFVYCSVKWALSHKKPLQSKLATGEDPLSLGKKNEHKCIEWVRNKYGISTDEQILFKGTGENNLDFLTSEIGHVSMSCKPDLIVSKANRNLLFEFKIVEKPVYLDLSEFDSDHAQVWCYTKLKERQIHEYHLFRYFIDPTLSFGYPSPRRYSNKTYEDKILSLNQMNSQGFDCLFEKYIKIIETFKSENTEINKACLADPETFSVIKSLPTQQDKKCKTCIRRIKHECDIYDKTFI